MSYVEVKKQDYVAYVTLNRPEVLNAYNWDMVEEITENFRWLSEDEQVRAVVLRSSGDRSFCVGADLKERKTLTTKKVQVLRSKLEKAHDLVTSFPKPIIAAVRGYALGGGMEFALNCDFIIAADDAVFGLTETALGIIPGGGGTQLLPRRIGGARAKELIFSARRINAKEAEAIGLVFKVVPTNQLDKEVETTIRAIAANAPISLREAKRAIDLGLEKDLRNGLKIEREAYNITLATEDRNEGLRAFAEKRKPNFQGR